MAKRRMVLTVEKVTCWSNNARKVKRFGFKEYFAIYYYDAYGKNGINYSSPRPVSLTVEMKGIRCIIITLGSPI